MPQATLPLIFFVDDTKCRPIGVLRSHVGAKLDVAIDAAIARLQGEVQEVEEAIKEDARKRSEAAAAAAAAPAKKK